MSLPGWRTALVLGGTGSGRSEYGESLLAPAGEVRRVTDPAELARLLTHAGPHEHLLVDGLDGWLAAGAPEDGSGPGARLAAAISGSTARVVLVSPEPGLSPSGSDRDRLQALGDLNRAVAAAVDAVVLVVAGQAVWLKGGPEPRPARPVTATAAVAVAAPDLADLGDLPPPDERVQQAVAAGLAGAGLGVLEPAVTFAAGTQGRAAPAAWPTVRVFVLHADHGGGAAAGAVGSAALAAALRAGTTPLARLAAGAAAQVQLVEAATAAPIEDGPAMSHEAADQAMTRGWQLAQQAADDGVDVIVLSAIGDGAEAAAAAVAAALGGSSTEPAALLGRVHGPDGMIDDDAWIRRCAAVRDALHRSRAVTGTAVRAVLAELAGADIATATGLILGAAARRTPVLFDGPVGAAAALVARGLAGSSRRWCLLADHGRHPTVVRASEVLGLAPVLDLRLRLGEGGTTLAALPLLRTAIELACEPG